MPVVGAQTMTAVCAVPSPCSAAGEFFPEAAQVAYRMWELSAVAVAKVEVRAAPSLPLPPALCSSLAWISLPLSIPLISGAASCTACSPACRH